MLDDYHQVIVETWAKDSAFILSLMDGDFPLRPSQSYKLKRRLWAQTPGPCTSLKVQIESWSEHISIFIKSSMKMWVSSHRYGLELASNIPDQSSGMKRNIGIIAYLIKYGDGRCRFDCFASILAYKDRLDVLCGAPDVSRYSIIAHDTL